MIGGNLDEGGIFMSQFLNDPKKFDQVQVIFASDIFNPYI